MIIHSFLDKFNMIMSDSDLNVGVAPIAYLYYGNGYSRLLVHFSLSELTKAVEDKLIPDISKTRHKLRIFNCGGLSFDEYAPLGVFNKKDVRAAGFKIIVFKIPEEFTGGRGFDFTQATVGKSRISYDGATWRNASTGKPWSLHDGIYSTDYLEQELLKYENGDKSIIVGTQTFNTGDESINVDITTYVNDVLSGKEQNNGLCIALDGFAENVDKDGAVAFSRFFTHKTHTFMEPFVETVYEDHITDDRHMFYKGKTNRLYLYSNIAGNLKNLDDTPKCSIDTIGELEVKQASRGVYYVEIPAATSVSFVENTMYYDTWSNIIFNGNRLPDVEMDFVVRSQSEYFNMGNIITKDENYVPVLTGIKNSEVIHRGDVRKLEFVARVPYTADKCLITDGMSLRLYIMDADMEYEVLPYDKLDMAANSNYYTLFTEMLPPATYHIDVKVENNGETIVHKDIVRFTIVNDVTSK